MDWRQSAECGTSVGRHSIDAGHLRRREACRATTRVQETDVSSHSIHRSKSPKFSLEPDPYMFGVLRRGERMNSR